MQMQELGMISKTTPEQEKQKQKNKKNAEIRELFQNCN